MNSSTTLNRRTLLSDFRTTAIAVFAAVLLPQLFHAVGAISGTGAALGAALLPMHLPVLLAAFAAGPVVGCLAGIISPLVSFAVSGMPTAALLPFMMIELGVYGLTAGLLSKTKLNSFVQLLLTQIAGRAARALAIVAVITLLGNTALTFADIPAFVTTGLFGILLQWAIVPLMTHRFRHA